MNLFKDVVIPLIRQAITADEGEQPNKQLEILLVEDCQTDVDLIRDTFSEHKLHVALTFQEALTLIRELRKIDAAFIDLNIPGGHGMDLVNRVRTKHIHARIAATSGDASILRPEDQGWIIMKNARMAQDFKDFLTKKNGQKNGKINYQRLFFVMLFLFIIWWLIIEFRLLNNLVNQLKRLGI